jgi:hypothetical protein
MSRIARADRENDSQNCQGQSRLFGGGGHNCFCFDFRLFSQPAGLQAHSNLLDSFAMHALGGENCARMAPTFACFAPCGQPSSANLCMVFRSRDKFFICNRLQELIVWLKNDRDGFSGQLYTCGHGQFESLRCQVSSRSARVFTSGPRACPEQAKRAEEDLPWHAAS